MPQSGKGQLVIITRDNNTHQVDCLLFYPLQTLSLENHHRSNMDEFCF